MNDESQLQRVPQTDRTALSETKARSTLFHRGLVDSTNLVRRLQLEREDPLLKWLRLAEEGDVQAQWKLGHSYFNGNGVLLRGDAAYSPTVQQSFSEALRWFKKAAEAGDQESARYVGFIFHDGLGVSRDYAQAVRWLQKSVPSEFGVAEWMLGECFYFGTGVDQDYAQAVQWLLKALPSAAPTTSGDLYCRLQSSRRLFAFFENNYQRPCESSIGELLGCIYSLGPLRINPWHDDTSSYIEEFYVSRPFAERGHSDAQFWLALAYVYGRGVVQDDTEAAHWLYRAASSGHISAQFHLGQAHAQGRGVPQDDVQAFFWIHLSCSTGPFSKLLSTCQATLYDALTEDQISQAVDLEFGWYDQDRLPEDLPRALDFWRSAAEGGNHHAQRKLGNCYENGIGVAVDYAEAGKWFVEAGERGDRLSQAAAARLFLEGKLTSTDDDEFEHRSWSALSKDESEYFSTLSKHWLKEEELRKAKLRKFAEKPQERTPRPRAPVIELMQALQRSLKNNGPSDS